MFIGVKILLRLQNIGASLQGDRGGGPGAIAEGITGISLYRGNGGRTGPDIELLYILL